MIPRTRSNQGIHAHSRLSRLRSTGALVQPAAVSGASLTGYSLVIGPIAAVAITSVATLGEKGRAIACRAQNTISAALGGNTSDCAPAIAGGSAAGDGGKRQTSNRTPSHLAPRRIF